MITRQQKHKFLGKRVEARNISLNLVDKVERRAGGKEAPGMDTFVSKEISRISTFQKNRSWNRAAKGWDFAICGYLLLCIYFYM